MLNLISVILLVLLVFSLSGNAYFLFLKPKALVKRQNSRELSEFLGDLLTGDGLVRVSRVDPENVLLRSPRTP